MRIEERRNKNMRILVANMRILAAMLMVLVLLGIPTGTVGAATTADIAVNATPGYISIALNVTAYAFGTVLESSVTNTTSNHFGITNISTIVTHQYISVVNNTWTGGVAWTHSETATAGVDTVGLLANRGGTWGTGDVIVKNADPNYIYESCPVATNYAFGLGLQAPTSFSDGELKANTVRVTATSNPHPFPGHGPAKEPDSATVSISGSGVWSFGG